MSMAKKISVCIPVYNGAKYIRETVDSVLSQNVAELELLIQDNASTDSTLRVLREFSDKDSRVKVFASDATIGMAANWNKIISRAGGEFVMLLSADDLLAPDFLSKCLKIFALTGVAAVTTNHYWLTESYTRKKMSLLREGILSDFAIKTLLFNPFSINFTLFRRHSLETIRGANGEIFSSRLLSCDYDLWYRIAFSGQCIYFLNEPLGFYRVHENNLSRNVRRMTRHAVIVVLHYSDKLRARWPLLYKLSMLRFIFRIFRETIRGAGIDRRLLRVLLSELF